GDWLSIGAGVLYGPSYEGSNDYVISPLPVIQGRVAGIGISTRPAGAAFDVLPKPKKGLGLAFGPSFRVRSSRAVEIDDPVVERLGTLRRAVEVGVSGGISAAQVLDPYDKLAIGLDVRWDVNKAHRSMVLQPSISYFTPVSRGMAVALNLDAEHGGDRFMDYYYTITPAGSAASGLPTFAAHGGWTHVGVTLLTLIDFDGDLTNGGPFALVGGGYARMLGDARRSPITSIRGSPNQWLAGAGLGWTF
ncbi:MAG: MipA/OmpV family protein, partial [Novosphingobium sp.]|nr:MipA/OmpV family protein [Novosphingobium sp.]